MKKPDLAVNHYRKEIVESLANSRVLVIEAPTGSGKTTQIPQILHEAGYADHGIIGMTQPRRIAAISVSQRIADEMGTVFGEETGYKIRFDDHTSPSTKIKIMTDGILLQEMKGDPNLSKYSVIVVDEAHERSLNIDFIMGLLKQLVEKRDDFKVVVSSATINAPLFSAFFNNAPVLSVKTRPFPVEERYVPLRRGSDDQAMIEKIGSIVYEIDKSGEEGDILVFLHGEAAIRGVCDLLETINKSVGNTLEILPIYARLSPEEQNRVFDTFPGQRKVVVATNIAETSITIDGIVFVIDSGIVKMNYYNARTFSSSLETKLASKASCEQRKGRAGRTRPGIAYRLYSQDDYNERDEFTPEEIFRSDLTEVVLRMIDLGIADPFKFDFISPPSKGFLYSAIETLTDIGALEYKTRALTSIGSQMTDFPLGPRQSRIILESMIHCPDVIGNVLIIITFLSIRSPFLFTPGEEMLCRNAHKKLRTPGGDFFTYIDLFHKYKKVTEKDGFCKQNYLDPRIMNESINIHAQLCSIVSDKGVQIQYKRDADSIMRCIVSGLRQYVARADLKIRNTYLSATEKGIRLHPSSFLFGEEAKWIVAGEMIDTGRLYARTASPISEETLRKHFSYVYDNLVRGGVFNKNAPREKKEERKFKQSDTVDIFGTIFHFDAKGVLILPYQHLSKLIPRKRKILAKPIPDLSAKILFGETTIATDKLDAILHYFDKINLKSGLLKKYPANRNLHYPNDWALISRGISDILRPVLPHRKANHAAWLTFATIEEGVYEYVIQYDFFTAVDTSIEALEALFEEKTPMWSGSERKVLEKKFNLLERYANDGDELSERETQEPPK